MFKSRTVFLVVFFTLFTLTSVHVGSSCSLRMYAGFPYPWGAFNGRIRDAGGIGLVSDSLSLIWLLIDLVVSCGIAYVLALQYTKKAQPGVLLWRACNGVIIYSLLAGSLIGVFPAIYLAENYSPDFSLWFLLPFHYFPHLFGEELARYFPSLYWPNLDYIFTRLIFILNTFALWLVFYLLLWVKEKLVGYFKQSQHHPDQT